ncbi:MAG: hypothetical protein ACJ72I_18270 [Pseudonocardiaceae bacterium]
MGITQALLISPARARVWRATLRAAVGRRTSLPTLVDDVIAQARRRSRQLPGGGIDPADWLRQRQQGWAHPGKSDTEPSP